MEGFYHSVQQRERKKEGAKVKFNVRISMRIYGWLDEVKVLISTGSTFGIYETRR